MKTSDPGAVALAGKGAITASRSRWAAFRHWGSQILACRLCRNLTLAVFLAILVIEALILVPSYRNHEENLLRQQETIARQAITAFLATKGSELKQAHVTQLMGATGLLGLQLQVNGDTFAAGEPVVNPGPAEARLRDLERVKANALDLQWSQGEWLMDYPVAARLDVSGISGELWAFVLRILGLSLIIALFVTVVTMVVLDRMMLSPLLRLRARITQAGEDAEHPLDYIRPTERCDEFGEVESAFNQMLMQSDSHLHRLSTLNAELDQLVAERTQSLRATEQELKIRTWYDQLTGLANRPLFEERLNRYLATFDPRRPPWQGALVMLGLDDFQTINGLAGHAAGDRMLQEIARRLGRHSRERGHVARLGGDIFAVLLTNLAKPDSEELQSEVQAIARAAMAPVLQAGRELQCEASIGVAVIPADGQDSPTLLRHAEIAMQRAKKSHDTSVQFFSRTLSKQVRQRQEVLKDLKVAIANQQLRVHYQPQFNQVRQCVGYEALVRWQHPERGMMPPSEFIPLAEETSLILKIGEWVLDHAMATAKRWLKQGFTGRIAVNLSVQQLMQDGLVGLVASKLAEHDLRPNQLELEITETALMADVDRALAVMRELRGLGVQLAVDDFGTGYSSLAYLKQLPVSRIKIDRAFVMGLPANEQDAILCRTIVNMAHGLGCEVIAEGVETEAQAQWLIDIECDELQGFLLGRPEASPRMTPVGCP